MQDVLVEEIYIEAPPECVFAAWTEASHLIAWWGDGAQFRTVGWEGDVRAGGQWQVHFVDAKGKPFSATGVYIRVERPAFLSFTWKPQWDNDPPTTMELEFQTSKTGTLLKLRQYGFASAAARDLNKQAWGPTASWLRSYLESTVIAGRWAS
ncbi:MAG: SRPBCC domain-containing protein [Pseudomonadota bacterium]|nr:SRPBCC domain-containing protein [Pseudomonadota bacterium]